ncbi:hypothetical protein ACFQX6_12585 [Streptosporangium lutulentum]
MGEVRGRGYGDFRFNILVGDAVVPLAVPAGQSADKYFSSRISANNPDAIYLSVNLAITDAPYTGVQGILADSKTDLYTVNPTYLASNPDPFPGRGAVEQRGFFLFGDGHKNAEFSSPDAVYVTVDNAVIDAKPSAVVKKLKGNKNELTITVKQTHIDGSKSPVTATFTINNNAAALTPSAITRYTSKPRATPRCGRSTSWDAREPEVQRAHERACAVAGCLDSGFAAAGVRGTLTAEWSH